MPKPRRPMQKRKAGAAGRGGKKPLRAVPASVGAVHPDLIRYMELEKIAKRGGPKAANALARALWDSAPTVRWIGAIGLGDRGPAAAGIRGVVRKLGEMAKKDPSPEVRWASGIALSNVLGKKALRKGKWAQPEK